MPKLSDTQAVLLAAAAARSDLSVLPPPATLKLKGAALERTLRALLGRGLIAEAASRAETGRRSGPSGVDQERKRLVVTPAGLDAIGVESQHAGGCAGDTAPAAQTIPSRKARDRAASWRSARCGLASGGGDARGPDRRLGLAAAHHPRRHHPAPPARLRRAPRDHGDAQGLSPGPGGLIDGERRARPAARMSRRRLSRRWKRGSERCPACRSPSCGRPGPRPGAHRRRRERGGGC